MNQEEVWDAIAEKWADFRQKPTGEVLEFLRDKEGKVLDLGCGSGRHSPSVIFGSRKLGVGSGLEFYGVDFSEKLLELAGDKGYAELVKSEVFDVPYGDEEFDYVVFSRVLHCVDSAEKRREALGEVYRVLKEGGEALIISWGRKGCERLKGEKEGFVPWDVAGEKIWRYTYVYDLDELRRELEDVGFKILKEWEDGNVGFVVGK